MKKVKLLTSSAIVMTMVVGSIVPACAYSKEETVYTKLETDGTAKEVIVSEHLINDENEDTLTDVSTLSDIVNVNGNEKFTQDGNTITWQTGDGQDIYYQGNTEEKLPVSMKISYKLNGKETKLKDMLGKKGDVEITIDYTNHEKRTVDGEELYVPFVIAAGTMLSTKTDSNVEVTNGKVISNGSNNIVVGLATPGLSQNFDNNEDLAKLNSITIKYTTTKFKLNSIMSVASPSLLSETDLELGDFSSLFGSVDQLTAAYQQIVEGGKTLQAGTKALNEKMSEVVSATKQLEDGSNQLVAGIDQLVSGSDTLADGVDKLAVGAKQLSGGTSQLKNQLPALTNGVSVLSQSMSNLATGLTQMDQSIELLKNSITSLNDSMKNVSAVLTNEDIEQLKQYVDQLPETEQENYNSLMAKLETYHAGMSGIAGGISEINSKMETLSTAAAQLKDGSQQLVAGINQLVSQSGALVDGIDQLDTGAQQLSGGITQLKDKVPTLTKGVNALSTGMNQLADGIHQLSTGTELLKSEGTEALASGADALVDGMVEFEDQGLSKISDVLTHTLKSDVDKAEKLMNLSKEYKTLTGVSDDVEANTKLIMIVESISK